MQSSLGDCRRRGSRVYGDAFDARHRRRREDKASGKRFDGGRSSVVSTVKVKKS